MTEPLSPALQAYLALSPPQRAAADLASRLLQIDPATNSLSPKSQKQLAAEGGVSEATICRLVARWKTGVRGPNGEQLVPPMCKAALAPRRSGPPKGRAFISDEEAERVRDVAANVLRRRGSVQPLPFKRVHKELCAEEELAGTPAPSYAQVRYVLSRVPYQELLAWAGGVEALKKGGGLPRLVMAPPTAPNVEWYLDQWVADVFVQSENDPEPGRPVVVTVVDRFGGGFALGLAIHQRFTGFTVAEAVIDAIRRNGKARVLRLDLGRENRTSYLRAGCEGIGMQLAHTTPRDPAVKGLMEGVHNIYREFCSRLPWYAPSDIKTKPLREEPPLSFAAFCERFTAFVFGEYNTQPYAGLHGKQQQSRLQLRQAAAFTPIMVSEDELQVLFARRTLVTVRPQGIKLRNVFYAHPALGRLIGQRVWASQGRTDTSVLVHDQEHRLICEARNALAEAAQMDDEALRQYTADRRALAKARAVQADERIARARSQPDWMALRARKNLEAQQQAPARRAVRQITRATGETPAAQAAPAKQFKIFRQF